MVKRHVARMIGEDDLRFLGQGRWTVPMLAVLREQDGTRFAVLLAALGLPRDSLVRTLEHAIACGWVVRNSGHGHPLRPEYLLSPTGKAIGDACIRMMAARQAMGLGQESLPRWSLPILGQLERDWTRFSALRAALAPVTSRALSLALKQMIEGRLVGRRLEPSYPPATLYGLEAPGVGLLRSLRGA